LERGLREQGFALVAGVDEAGRGPLAGPVVAAAVILPVDWPHPGIDDSKRLRAARREGLARLLAEEALAWGVGLAEAEEVDRLNIHHASLTAMRRAVEALGTRPDHLLIDGRFTLVMDLPQRAVVGGDASCLAVAAASILAKVHRDGIMRAWHRHYPQYNFAANKGYGTAEHRQALTRHGPCPLHRRSYMPVAQAVLEFGHDGPGHDGPGHDGPGHDGPGHDGPGYDEP
jgi:ribonuclease HII